MQYKSFDSEMAINKRIKKGVKLLNQIMRINLLFMIILSPIILSAQIKISEDKPVMEKPWWDKFKDIVYAPYDSSYVFIKDYPVLDAYNKYIGQNLYLPSVYISRCGTRGNSDRLLFSTDKNYMDASAVKEHYLNKYFTIIDVLSLKDSELDWNCLPWGNERVELGDRTYSTTEDITPYFVLKENESGDIVYSVYPKSFVLVGGFVKIQQKFIGRNIFELSETPSRYNINKNIIKEKWLCNDVSLKVPPNGTYANDVNVNLTLVSVDDSTIEKTIEYDKVDFISWRGPCEYWSEILLDKTLKKIKDEENLRAKEDAIYKQRLVQEKAKYKQELTNKFGAATAEKIIAGKYEIGMSKSACKEIAGYATVIDKTATTETWRVVNIFEYSTFLYFTDDKLVRIVNL